MPWWVPYLPSKTQLKCHLFYGALQDSPHIRTAHPDCSPAHTRLSTKDKHLICIISRMNSTLCHNCLLHVCSPSRQSSQVPAPGPKHRSLDPGSQICVLQVSFHRTETLPREHYCRNMYKHLLSCSREEGEIVLHSPTSWMKKVRPGMGHSLYKLLS